MKNCVPLLGVVVAVAVPALAADRPGPNVIFILSDDLGVGDVGCYGQDKIKTPNIDRMAAEGLRFTRAYAGSPLCAPCRSTLMTGRHTGHTQIRHNPSQAADWNRTRQGDPPLADDTVTFAKLFKQSGYATAVIGKWGLGVPGQAGSPDRLGFDHFLGYDSHVAAHNYYPDHLWRDDKTFPLDGKTYSHDLFTADALDFIRAHKDRPFMVYLPYTIPHVKLDPPTLDPYADTDWPKPEKAYAAMVTRMDRDVGRIFDTLKELHLDDDTLVFFASDNGSERAGGHSATFFHSALNLRGLKNTPYEGGIRVPFIARWPGRVPGGKSTDQLFAAWDFLPTCAELLHVSAPPNIDGVSVLPTLLDHPDQQKQEPYLYWELAQANVGGLRKFVWGTSRRKSSASARTRRSSNSTTCRPTRPNGTMSLAIVLTCWLEWSPSRRTHIRRARCFRYFPRSSGRLGSKFPRLGGGAARRTLRAARNKTGLTDCRAGRKSAPAGRPLRRKRRRRGNGRGCVPLRV